MKPSTTSLLIKIKNTSKTSDNKATTKKIQKKIESTEFLRQNLKNAYDNDMKIESSPSKRSKNKLLSPTPSISTKAQRARKFKKIPGQNKS